MTDPNDPINAIFTEERDSRGGTIPGLTKREYFAAMMLQGYLASGASTKGPLAGAAVELADNLIAALNKEPAREQK